MKKKLTTMLLWTLGSYALAEGIHLNGNYNELMQEYNELMQNYNALRRRYNDLMNQYNHIKQDNEKLLGDFQNADNSLYMLQGEYDRLYERLIDALENGMQSDAESSNE